MSYTVPVKLTMTYNNIVYTLTPTVGTSICPLTDALVEVSELKKEIAKLKKQIEMLSDAQDSLYGLSGLMHDIVHLHDEAQ